MIGERVGCFLLVTSTEQAAVKTQSMLEMLQRSEVSNPPAYGAKIASTILADATLREAWHDDLITMSSRIRSMRSKLYDSLNSSGKYRMFENRRFKIFCFLTWLGAPGSWEHLIRQSGMFGFLGLPPSVVQRLRGSFCRCSCHFSEILTHGDLRAISHLHGRQLSHINCWSQQTKRGLRRKVNHWVPETRILVETG